MDRASMVLPPRDDPSRADYRPIGTVTPRAHEARGRFAPQVEAPRAVPDLTTEQRIARLLGRMRRLEQEG